MKNEQSPDTQEISLISAHITRLAADFNGSDDSPHAGSNKAGKLTFLYDMIAACQSEIVQSLTLNHAIASLNLNEDVAHRELKAARKRKDPPQKRTPKDPSPLREEAYTQFIEVKGGDLPLIVSQAEKILVDSSEVFQRGGVLVRIVHIPEASQNKGINRASGSIQILPVEPLWLAKELTAKSGWCKFDARSQKHRKIDCPQIYAMTLLAKGEWKLPALEGIIEAPTLRPDGSILDQPGYDPQTGLFFHPSALPAADSSIPTSPSRDDALKALDILTYPLSQFPFETNEDFSVAISAVLTALIRKSLRSAPLHAFSAPKMRSGKTLLTHIVSLITTGQPAAVINQAENTEEEKKRFLALLMEGDGVVVIDNITGPLKSDALCSILTEEYWKERLLGTNRTVKVPTNSTFMATGNNLTLAGDLSSRALLCYLDPKCERPEERNFTLDLHHFISSNRPILVTAGLTILRSFHLAGRPTQNLRPYGGFEDWSNWIRGAIVWLGMPDPCKTRARIEEGDIEREQLGTLLAAWHIQLGETYVHLNTLLPAIGNEPLKNAMLAIARNHEGGIDTAKLGFYLRKFVNREENGLKIIKGKKTARGIEWRVTRTHGEPGQLKL